MNNAKKKHFESAAALKALVLAAQNGQQQSIDELCAAFRPLIMQEARYSYVKQALGEEAENTAWMLFLEFIMSYKGKNFLALPGLIKVHLHYSLLHKVYPDEKVEVDGRKALLRSKLEKAAHSMIIGVVQAMLYVLLLINVASALGIDITGVVALASVLTLAVSLALQNMLANVMSQRNYKRYHHRFQRSFLIRGKPSSGYVDYFLYRIYPPGNQSCSRQATENFAGTGQ